MSTVTCHTNSCENQDRPIRIELDGTDPDTGEPVRLPVACGACGQPISDIVDGA